MSIETKHITKYYDRQKALDNVSFTVNTGEIIGLLGPNGAGKSTLMKIITGFISPSSGQVIINGIDTSRDPILIRKQIGYLPENNPLYNDMYIKEYLEYTGRIFKLGPKLKPRVEEMIHLTGLTPEKHKKIGALSKGYKQRVGLAQALIHDPAVLILDEPTSGLDPNQIIEIRNLISETGKEKTVILSTHIMQEVEAICDRIVIINKGEIVADDSTSKIQSNTDENLQTILVEFQGDIKPELLNQIDGVLKVIKVKDKSWLLQGSRLNDLRPVVFQFAVANKLIILSLQVQEKSLEQIFQELTKN
ncbi:MAG: gliding motility-associated ABC transporter ATP-binding subunit GldA [Bacteroidales bacterium]|nr:gliding motility-associated ABC transporter ATP-binding subunit GldA [Bacteroidales bacterium]